MATEHTNNGNKMNITETNKAPATLKTVKLNDSGISGSGAQVFQVITTRDGRRFHTETFDTRGEAESWITPALPGFRRVES